MFIPMKEENKLNKVNKSLRAQLPLRLGEAAQNIDDISTGVKKEEYK